jgi:phosphoribosylanthranilate isomerase
MLHLSEDADRDWQLAAGACSRAPLLLAADGLGADNVAEAVTTARPWGIDVWEAVESEPGRLDPGRLAELIDAVRGAASEPDGDGSETSTDDKGETSR